MKHLKRKLSNAGQKVHCWKTIFELFDICLINQKHYLYSSRIEERSIRIFDLNLLCSTDNNLIFSFLLIITSSCSFSLNFYCFFFSQEYKDAKKIFSFSSQAMIYTLHRVLYHFLSMLDIPSIIASMLVMLVHGIQ